MSPVRLSSTGSAAVRRISSPGLLAVARWAVLRWLVAAGRGVVLARGVVLVREVVVERGVVIVRGRIWLGRGGLGGRGRAVLRGWASLAGRCWLVAGIQVRDVQLRAPAHE